MLLSPVFLLLGSSHHSQISSVHIWPEVILYSEYFKLKEVAKQAIKPGGVWEGLPSALDILRERGTQGLLSDAVPGGHIKGCLSVSIYLF